MKEITSQIQEIAKRLFTAGEIDLLLAWEKGNQEYAVKPYFARSIEDVENIVFSEYSIHNLANALLKYRDGQERIGIVAKGCDSRGVIRLLEDLQFKRERLYIIGIPCPGMKDPLLAARNNSGFSKKNEAEGLAKKCRDCIQPNPVIYDELVGAKQTPHLQGERFAGLKPIEDMTFDQRYQFFEDSLSKCIRCYACRQVCVACDCRTCIFDEMKPQWVGRENSVTDNMMYHLVRASHMVGRCIECGECERVCPVNIPLMLINQRIINNVNEQFGPYEAGMKYEEGSIPPMSMYKEKDPDNFL